MDIRITDNTPVEKHMHITVDPGELEPRFEEAVRLERSKLDIKGFRKGKAPLDLVKKLYGESIAHSSLTTIAEEFFRKATEENGIQPIGDPVLTDMKYNRGESLSFTIRYEIKPEIKHLDYKDIRVERPVHAVTEEEIEDEILHLRKANMELLPAQSAADEHHLVIADVQELDHGGAPLIGKKTQGMKLMLSEQSLHPKIREALLGASEGDVRRANIEAERAGERRATSFEFRVQKVSRVVLPEFDDAFVDGVTKHKVTTTGQFRTRLRADLEARWNEFAERAVADAIVSEIVRRHDIAVPESMIYAITDSAIADLKEHSKGKLLPKDFDEEAFRREFRPTAIFQAKWFFIREAVIEAEGIDVDEADLERRAHADSAEMGIEPERLAQYYKSSSAVKDRLVSGQLMNVLKDNAAIVDTAAAPQVLT